MDHNATALSSVMARVLSFEQPMASTAAQTAQLGKDAKDNDDALDSAVRGQLNEVMARLEEKNTKLMLKVRLLESAAAGAVQAVARFTGAQDAQGPAIPAPPPGLALEQLAASEAALKEFDERHTSEAAMH